MDEPYVQYLRGRIAEVERQYLDDIRYYANELLRYTNKAHIHSPDQYTSIAAHPEREGSVPEFVRGDDPPPGVQTC